MHLIWTVIIRLPSRWLILSTFGHRGSSWSEPCAAFPLTSVEILSQDQSYLMTLWPFFTMHSGAHFLLSEFQICFTCRQSTHRDPTTGSLKITSWILVFRQFPNPNSKFQEISFAETSVNREVAELILPPRSLPLAHFLLETRSKHQTRERMSYLDSHVCTGCFCGIWGCLIGLHQHVLPPDSWKITEQWHWSQVQVAGVDRHTCHLQILIPCDL